MAGAVLAMVASPVHAQDDEESGDGENLCDLHDSRLRNASGITADPGGDGWWVLPDGRNQDGGMNILRVGADCSVRDSESIYLDHPPLDPQALAFDSDGGQFVWAADIGEDDGTRGSAGITQVEVGNVPNNRIFRFLYPDGMQHAEAFLLLPDGKTPLLIPSVEGQAPLYLPTTEKQDFDTPMRLAGTVQLTEGGTVTGAALNADATKVVVRAASHAYEWDVKDGDVVQAMTDTDPLITELSDPGEAQDITYDADGNFITLSQMDEDGTFGTIARYTPAVPESDEVPAEEGGEESAAAEDGGGIVDWILDLGFETIVRILSGIAIVGFLVMLGGILVIRKSRRQRSGKGDDDDQLGVAAEESVFGDVKDDPLPPDPVELGLDAGQPDPEVGQLVQGAVYGSPKADPSGNVYGAKRPESTGGVYGAPKTEEPPSNVYGAARSEPGGSVYRAPDAAGSVYRAPAPEPKPERTGSVYGGPREDPQYGAFEAAGQGSIYNDAGGGGSFAAEPPAPAAPPAPAPAPAPPSGGVYGAQPAATPSGGSVYGAQGSSAESAGRVYGAGRNGERTPESDDDSWGPKDGGAYGR
ncbi:hypothetical protein L0U85_19335 [Glycomyces sp. L485]|nr:hypothetical protein [Glycomyces sp. L485]